jgi:hypothetical protein
MVRATIEVVAPDWAAVRVALRQTYMRGLPKDGAAMRPGKDGRYLYELRVVSASEDEQPFSFTGDEVTP